MQLFLSLFFSLALSQLSVGFVVFVYIVYVNICYPHPHPHPPKKCGLLVFLDGEGSAFIPSPPIATHSNRSSTLKLHGVSVCQMTNSKGITPVLDLQNFSNFNQDYAESVSKSVNPKDSHQQRYA